MVSWIQSQSYVQGGHAKGAQSEDSNGCREQRDGLSPMDRGDAPCREELKSIMSDAFQALKQMHTVVNEVLDYRSITSGLSSLKYDKRPVSLKEVQKCVIAVVCHCHCYRSLVCPG